MSHLPLGGPASPWQDSAACPSLEAGLRQAVFEDDDGASEGLDAQCDPICKIEIPVPNAASASAFWQHLIGFNRLHEDKAHAHHGLCLVASPWHMLELRQDPPQATRGRQASAGPEPRACPKVLTKLGLTFPEAWLPGVAQVAADFGCKLVTPLIALESAGNGRLKMLEIEGPGGSVIRIMSQEDVEQMIAISDDSAAALLEKELEVDDVAERLEAETARIQAEEILRSAGREIPEAAADADVDAQAKEEEVLHLEAKEGEAAKLIWLHGSGLHSSIRHELTDDVAEGWATSASQLDMPWCKLVLPAARFRPVSFLRNLVRPSWFDLAMDGAMDEVSPIQRGSEDLVQLRESFEFVGEVIAREKDSSGVPVVLGGFGPGAVLALWILLSRKSQSVPDAVILCNAWAPASLMRPKNMQALKGIPVLVLIGGSDPVVPAVRQNQLAQHLLSLGFNVTRRNFPGLSHTFEPGQQGKVVRDFVLEQALKRQACQPADLSSDAEQQALKRPHDGIPDGGQSTAEASRVSDDDDADAEAGVSRSRHVPEPAEHVNVTFTLRKASHMLGQKVMLSGSSITLGDWDPSKMVQLETNESSFPIWSATVRMPAFSKTAYKYFVIDPPEQGGKAKVEMSKGESKVEAASDDGLLALAREREIQDVQVHQGAAVIPLSASQPPAQPDADNVHEIVRSVTVYRRPLVVRDTFGQDMTCVDAALSEARPHAMR